MDRLCRKLFKLETEWNDGKPHGNKQLADRMEHQINRAQLLLQNALEQDCQLEKSNEYAVIVEELSYYQMYWKRELRGKYRFQESSQLKVDPGLLQPPTVAGEACVSLAVPLPVSNKQLEPKSTQM